MSRGLRERTFVATSAVVGAPSVRRTTLARGFRPERRRQDRRGVALLMVIGTLMFLTVLVTDIGFGARVRFLTAVHERDEQKAYWLAQTGVNVYRLILTANKAIAKNSMFASALEAYGVPAGDALWKMVPFINTGLLRMLAGGDSPDDEELEEFAQTGEVSEEVREESREGTTSRFGNRNFLDFDGDFSAEVRGEDCRINVNTLGDIGSGEDWQTKAVAVQLYGLLSGEENEQFLRERNLERWDLIGNLKDWVDADGNVSSGRGGYEDDHYNTQRWPYLAKNADFDTWEEIRMVEGWQDDVFERFGSQLTIYGGGKVNVNCADDQVLIGLLKAYGGGTMSDDELKNLLSLFKEATALSPPKDANAWVEALTNVGFPATSDLKSVIGTKTETFTIVSTGTVGDANSRITSVVSFSGSTAGGQVKYWRVD